MTNGRRLVLAFTFKLGQKQAQLRSAMETVKICSKCVGSTINAGSGFHGSSVLRLFLLIIILITQHMLDEPCYVKRLSRPTTYIVAFKYSHVELS